MGDSIVEALRRQRLQELNQAPGSREYWEARYGQVWNTDEVCSEFEVRGFAAPFCVAKRRSDGVVGSLEFAHSPRFYFNFVPYVKAGESHA